MQIVCGIITISDRASAGDYKDLGGPALKELAQKNGWQVLSEAVIPDDAARIQETIRSFSKQGCGLILTTGGTGVGPRDVTPEAIRAIMRVELPGFGEVMRAESASGQTERCRGMSRVCRRRNSAWRRGRTAPADIVLGRDAALRRPRTAQRAIPTISTFQSGNVSSCINCFPCSVRCA